MVLTRLKQLGILLLGVAVAVGMSLLGRWQLDVYQDQGEDKTAARAAEPARELLAVAPAGGTVEDGYGRTVRFRGEYVPDIQLLVPNDPADGSYRVLNAVALDDRTAVAVVRGVTDDPDYAAAPPSGTQEGQGLLLPSEPSNDLPVEEGQISSVRLSELAQEWPYQLVPGFVTLDPELAAEQDLVAAPVEMPQEGGRLRNGMYALQWWVFAAATMLMAIRISVDLGRAAREQELDELKALLADQTDEPPDEPAD